MIVYKVFNKNYELKKGDFIGLLIERRKDLRGMTRVESGLKWARLIFGNRVKNKNAIFVVPSELNLKYDGNWLVQKGVFTKEEFLEMMKIIDQGIKIS
ncbi:MAG: hypothetical protein ACPL6D_02250 [Thermodesulfobacteriota bacterium]